MMMMEATPSKFEGAAIDIDSSIAYPRTHDWEALEEDQWIHTMPGYIAFTNSERLTENTKRIRNHPEHVTLMEIVEKSWRHRGSRMMVRSLQ